MAFKHKTIKDQSDTQIYNVVSFDMRTKYFLVCTEKKKKAQVPSGAPYGSVHQHKKKQDVVADQ